MAEATARKSSILDDLNFRLAIPLLAQTIFVHLAVTIGRVATSYKAIDLDLSPVWIGAMSGAFSFLPAVLAVPVGRIIDRGYDSRATWIGSALLAVGGLAYCLIPLNGPTLFLATAFLGVGQLGCMAGHQMIAVRASRGVRGRDAIFGYHMVAIAAGQGLAPFAIAWLAGGARIPPIMSLYVICLVAGVISLAIAVTIPPAADAGARAEGAGSIPLRGLMAVKGLMAFVMASVITITSLDVIVVYLPLLGVERGIDAGTIGLMMTCRAVASMAARIAYVPLIDVMGRGPLTYVSMLSPAAAFALVAAPVPVWLMYPLVIVCGLGLGVSATLTLSGVVEVAPREARATALSMRLSGNRFGLAFIPFIAGFFATFTGAGGVFMIVSALLAISTAGVWRARRT